MRIMNRISRKALFVAALLVGALAVGVSAQVYKYYSPGSVWTVTMIRMKPGMDQAYHAYLDGEFKKGEDAQVKAGYEKSYKILETMDEDSDSWNMLILREYKDLASIEANTEKSDVLAQQTVGDDQKSMQGY